MRFIIHFFFVYLTAAGLLVTGCNSPKSFNETDQSETASDHSEMRQHAHGHGHPHAHSHSTIKPAHGGRMVPIGHTHQGSEATHYYAEIMPPADGKVTMYLTRTDAYEKSQPLQIDAEEILAYAAPLDRQAGLAPELVFHATKDGDRAVWSAKIPESLKEGSGLSVVIPKLTLGDEWQNFSFQTSSVPPSDLSEDTTAEDSE